MIAVLLPFLRKFWPYLIVGICFIAIWTFCKYQTHELKVKDATIATLQATIAQTKLAGEAQNKKAVESQEKASVAVNSIASESKDEIARIKKYYENKKPSVKYVPVNGVCQSISASSGELSSVSKDSEGVSEAGDTPNSITGERSFESDCAEVTIWYTKMYRSWEAGCNEVECR